MNRYEKELAQIERKQVFHLYNVWIYPLSDYGVEELEEGGHLTEYKFYYDDPHETEAERTTIARQGAMMGASFSIDSMPVELPFTQGRIRQVRFREKGVKMGFLPNMIEGVDFAVQVTKQDLLETEPVFTFDDIQPVQERA